MKTILYVEDDPTMLNLIGDILGKEHRMLLAENPAIGLGMLSVEDVDLIITGNHMPVMCGTDFLEIVKDRYPALPVIMLTGSRSPELPAKCKALGAVEFLEKPVQFERLKEVIKQAIDEDKP